MDTDTEHKKVGREMMRMTEEINSKYFTKVKRKVTCQTCHQGHEEPPKER